MALSNMFNEPKREITETLVGIFSILGIVAIDYVIVKLLDYCSNQPPTDPLYVKMGLVFPMMVMFVLVVIACLYFVHRIGEIMCTFLENRGLQIRPCERKVR